MIVNKLKFNGPGFPAPLKHIHDPPQVIYWTGQQPERWMDKPKLAVVGSRKFTPYGKAVTEKLVSEAAAAGVVIISGLAYGIDIIAHQAALAVSGTTVAVLPCGLGNVYPAGHASIAKRITQKGSLISEYPPAAGIAFKSNFIARNRLISGLADALVVPQAALKSGSLHTARFAMEQGKTVMAVPGDINSLASEGANNLIKSGAMPVTCVDDIFFALKITPAVNNHKAVKGTDLEKTLYKLINSGVQDQEQLALSAKTDASALSSALTMLEISGHIRPAGAGMWIAS